jgi:hypothetical protein
MLSCQVFASKAITTCEKLVGLLENARTLNDGDISGQCKGLEVDSNSA